LDVDHPARIIDAFVNGLDRTSLQASYLRLEGEELIEAHKEWMKTEEAKAANRLRGSVIERCFADAKRHRHLRRLHGRGLKRAKAEIGLVVLVQTALSLARLRNTDVKP